jgi:hypothetical protein
MKMPRRLSLWATLLLTSTHISKSFLPSRASTIITVEPSHQDGSMCLRYRMSLRAVCAKQSPIEWGRFVCGSRRLPWYGSPALAGGARVSRTVPGRAFDPPLSAKPRFTAIMKESLPGAWQLSRPRLRGLSLYPPRSRPRLR